MIIMYLFCKLLLAAGVDVTAMNVDELTVFAVFILCDIELFRLLFKEIINELTNPDCGDDYEKIADGYHRMLLDDLEAFKDALAILDKPRLDKKHLRYHLQACIEELQKNL